MSAPQLMRTTFRRQLAVAGAVSLALTVMVLVLGALGTSWVSISRMGPAWLGGGNGGEAVGLRARVAEETVTGRDRAPSPERRRSATPAPAITAVAATPLTPAQRPAARVHARRTATHHMPRHRVQRQAARTNPTPGPATITAAPAPAAAQVSRSVQSANVTPLPTVKVNPGHGPRPHGHGLALGHAKHGPALAQAPTPNGHGPALGHAPKLHRPAPASSGHGLALGHAAKPVGRPGPHGPGLARGHRAEPAAVVAPGPARPTPAAAHSHGTAKHAAPPPGRGHGGNPPGR